MKEKCINIVRVNIFSLIFTPIIFVGTIIPYRCFVEQNPDELLSPVKFVFLFTALIAGLLVHELIHDITFAKYNKSGFKSIKFGIVWKHVVLYCHCSEFITVWQYRIVLLMPSVILGFIPVILGFVLGNFMVLLFGCTMTMGGLGDFFCIWSLRGFNKNTLIMDHPSKVGFFYEEK
ncbi:MAG: DUF3267 domain-containing protein [Tannerellaceae bacterium]|jgi:hypothetical protein|nr:DUF3267 domain-containing protein [Tannerellaceae bacterium]